MEELLKFLEKNPIFFLATDDDSQPRVRPFGFHMFYDNKLYMVTALPKKVCKQMEKNPKVELCSMAPDTHFIRIYGEAVFDNDNMEAKKKVFEVMPDLLKMYGSAENPAMAIFYLKDMHATIASLTEEEKTLF